MEENLFSKSNCNIYQTEENVNRKIGKNQGAHPQLFVEN